MFKTYKFKSSHTNKVKLDSIRELGQVYKVYFNNLTNSTVTEFYKNLGKLPKFLPRIDAPENFSERYKQTCGKQVKGTFQSWFSNVKNRVSDKITGSDLPEETKKQLYIINKYGLYFKKEIKLKGLEISPEIIKLANKIYHHCKGNYPKLRNTAMNLDLKVASIEKSKNSFDYWIKIATLEKGEPIFLPIESYDYFENKKGLLKKQVQIIIRPDKIEYGFVKDLPLEDFLPIKNKVIGIDTGLVIPLSTSTGNQYGIGLYHKLLKLDKQTSLLTSTRMKNRFYKPSDKLNGLYERARSLLKNEIGRITNEFFNKEKPEEIILENNKDLTTGGLENFSKKMRRIIKTSGINKIRDVLIEKSKVFGADFLKVNQAYTSQDCPSCHCIDSKNRKTQKIFKCIKCGFSRNADYVGSINIRNRRSIPSISIYTPYKKVRGLLEAYYESLLVLQT